MDQVMRGQAVASLLHDFEPTLPFVTARSRTALKHLRDAFEEGRSLAVLNSGWIAGSNHLMRGFLAELPNDISVVRITSSCTSVIDGMRQIIRAIGFEPKTLTATELHRIFENFLTFQSKRNRRTIVVVEESANNTGWVRDYTGRLVQLQEKGKFGLTVILMRQTRFDEINNEPPLDSASYMIGKHINLTPFLQAETRAFIRWRINAAETADIRGVMDFEAITLIHELCEGMPDAIEHLCCAALELADDEDMAPVSTDVVIRASKNMNLRPMAHQPVTDSRIMMGLVKGVPTLKPIETPRVILTYEGKTICEVPIGQQRISIGRSQENDLCIDSPYISRQHAVIFRHGAQTAIVDLESKNGTFVNARPVQVQTISDRDEISIGYHRILFLDPDAPRVRSLNGASRNAPTLNKHSKRSRLVPTGIKTDDARRQ